MSSKVRSLLQSESDFCPVLIKIVGRGETTPYILCGSKVMPNSEIRTPQRGRGAGI